MAKKKKKFFVGLDLALRSTGFVVLNHKGETVAAHRILTWVADTDYNRTAFIYNTIAATLQYLLTEDRTKPKIISKASMETVMAKIERLAFQVPGAKSSSRDTIDYMHHRIREHLDHIGVEYHIVSPGTLKKFATGTGVCKKEAVVKAVYDRWGFLCKNSDYADAYVLARMGYEEAFGTQKQMGLNLGKNRTPKGGKRKSG